MAFLAVYGWTMWGVQTFEYRLAALSIIRAPVKKPDRLIDTVQKAYSALEKQFATCRHRFERASAKELQQLLPDDLPETLQAEIGELILERNRLAHRYLRRTLEASEPPDLREELQALQKLGYRFVELGDHLLRLMHESVTERSPNVSEAQFEALQKLGQAAASGTSLDDALGAGM